jgi:hypothetical protein
MATEGTATTFHAPARGERIDAELSSLPGCLPALENTPATSLFARLCAPMNTVTFLVDPLRLAVNGNAWAVPPLADATAR